MENFSKMDTWHKRQKKASISNTHIYTYIYNIYIHIYIYIITFKIFFRQKAGEVIKIETQA